MEDHKRGRHLDRLLRKRDWTSTRLSGNALLVDPAGTVYVGTDVGVFSSSTASPNWTEVGPASSSGQSGFLPDVAVTALRLFSSGGAKKLRASTYGRGIWEFNLITTPDFQIAFPTTSQTIFPTQTATYNGTVTAFNGYSSQVALSCTGTVPSTCTLNPTQLTPDCHRSQLFNHRFRSDWRL